MDEKSYSVSHDKRAGMGDATGNEKAAILPWKALRGAFTPGESGVDRPTTDRPEDFTVEPPRNPLSPRVAPVVLSTPVHPR